MRILSAQFALLSFCQLHVLMSNNITRLPRLLLASGLTGLNATSGSCSFLVLAVA